MATTLYIAPTLVMFGAQFDSRKRYLRSGNPAADIPMVSGRSFFVGSANNGGASSTQWRYSVAGYAVEYHGTSSPALTDNADYVLVKP